MRRFLRSLSTTTMTRPPNWKARAPFPPVGNITYAQQESLPKLPVPALQSTLQKLKVSLWPLAKSEEEYNAALKKIDAFAAGAGPTLQKRLEARAAEPGREHWLEQWWDDLAYMGYRDSVCLMIAGWSRTPPLSLFIGRDQRLLLLYVDKSGLSTRLNLAFFFPQTVSPLNLPILAKRRSLERPPLPDPHSSSGKNS